MNVQYNSSKESQYIIKHSSSGNLSDQAFFEEDLYNTLFFPFSNKSVLLEDSNIAFEGISSLSIEIEMIPDQPPESIKINNNLINEMIIE